MTGHLYVADQSNYRIVELTAWGEFVKAWGWGVRDGSPELQTCTAVSDCQEGLPGAGAGQFDVPQGIAVDSLGNVYVTEWINRRVQKFDPTGGPSGDESEFLLSFGSPGTGDGQFDGWVVGSYIASGPGDEIYVGDEGRIQVFDSNGSYLRGVSVPGEVVQSLAVDPDGNLLLAFLKTEGLSKPNILKLDPSKPDPLTEPVCSAKIENPRAIAAGSDGSFYAVDSWVPGGIRPLTIRRFDSSCKEVQDSAYPFTDGFESSTGIAVNTVTEAGGTGLYVSNGYFEDSYIRAYYPPPDKWDPPAAAPTVVEQYAASVNTDSAVLRATINPRFWDDTRYRVEYGTESCSAGGCQVYPGAPGNLLGGGVVDRGVTSPGVMLSGLEPDTTYHYRFVVQSGGGGPVFGPDRTFTTFPAVNPPNGLCPNATFRTGPGSRLPNCRAYEMVSPLDKESGDVGVLDGAVSVGGRTVKARIDQAAPGGESITYSTSRAFGAPESAPWSSQYLASRDSKAGWTTRGINTPRSNRLLYNELALENPYKSFSDDLCSGWVLQDSDRTLVPGAPENGMNLYRRRNCGIEGFELLTSVSPPGFNREEAPVINYLPMIQGATGDGAHSLFRANAALTPDAAETVTFQLYESSEGSENRADLRLISVLPNGEPVNRHASLGTASGPGATDFRNASVHNAISSDGSRVFWSSSTEVDSDLPIPDTNGTGPGEVYLRANPLAERSQSGECDEAGKACTLQLAGPGSFFWTADPSGSTAIIQTGEDLFEAQIEEVGGALVSVPTPIATGVGGVMGASEDATRVYFTSSNVLAPGAVAGERNLYLHERGAPIRLVGTLGPFDSNPDGINSLTAGVIALDSPKAGWRLSRVSADGSHALFMSRASLTGSDNIDVASGAPDAEVFLYDAEAEGGDGRLVCISCNPSGARPAGRIGDTSGGATDTPLWMASRIPVWEHQGHAPRVLSEDGEFVFFESFQALVPSDTNGVADVYEWRRASGRIECEELGAALYVEDSGGCLSLISSGESPRDSSFIDASADGRDVFFVTEESLFVEDPGLFDLYDARVGGGFAPTPVRPTCQGEACQSPAVAPTDITPASASFRGPGNQAQRTGARRCPQGKRKVRRAGATRCVKPSKQQRKRDRKKNGRAGR
ncbi:MAG TPA: hypothetical protein VFY48_01835 [Solirubrobacterales bacterium]|nr:hypothetical protein [Solirubrobacterales bacterium]